MPYMDWHTIISIFGYKVCKCNECGTIHLQSKHGTVRIWGRSCSRHIYYYERLKEDITV